MSAAAVKKTLEEMQLKIAEYGVAEAKARKERAEVELETAKMHQEYVRQSWEMELRSKNGNCEGGIKS